MYVNQATYTNIHGLLARLNGCLEEMSRKILGITLTINVNGYRRNCLRRCYYIGYGRSFKSFDIGNSYTRWFQSAEYTSRNGFEPDNRHFSLLNVNFAGACGYDFVCDGRRLVKAYLRRRRGAI